MKFTTTLATLVAIVASTSAVAIPAAEAQPASISKRQDNGAWCGKRVAGDGSYYEITSWGSWDDDWGQGLLDNVRGQCGEWGNIENWGFNYEAGQAPTNGHAHFTAGDSARDTTCVENAIWAASQPSGAIWGVSCQWF